jgi:hypothetical protein
MQSESRKSRIVGSVVLAFALSVMSPTTAFQYDIVHSECTIVLSSPDSIDFDHKTIDTDWVYRDIVVDTDWV